ncbi:MAG: alpha/beta hydrolase [Bacteroidia bacterium]|nr:alpha/beta hydrolase [Bacteroidia bacterium]
MKTGSKNSADEDYQDYCCPGTHISGQWFSVEDHVALRIVTFTPPGESKYYPVVFISGLASVLEGFKETLIGLTRDFQVYYVDTREKSSSRITGKVRFDVETFSSDLCVLVRLLGLEDGKYSMFGYSLGATVIVDSYTRLDAKPYCALLLEPNATFNYPAFAVVIMKLELPLLYLFKPVVKWYIRHFRINRKEDYDMYLISARSLDNAHPVRLRKTALGISGYKIWDKLGDFSCPTLIVGTSKDHFHSHDEVKRMIENLKNCTYTDLETNRRTHSAELGIVIRQYIDGLKSKTSFDGTDI